MTDGQEQLQRRLSALMTVQNIAQELMSELDSRRLLHKILEAAIEVLEASAGSLLIWVPPNELEWAVSANPDLEAGDLETDDWLPSLNLVYQVGEANIRASYGRTLARPTFRELAPFSSFAFVGDYILTTEDILAQRTFPDTISHHSSNFDAGALPDAELFLVKDMKGPVYTCDMPYRCLTPQGVEGLLVVGLGASTHRDAMTLTRMQPDVQNQGYAAGVAAAMAAGGSLQAGLDGMSAANALLVGAMLVLAFHRNRLEAAKALDRRRLGGIR